MLYWNSQKAPLFRFSIAIGGLGLIRLFILSLINGYQAKQKAKDKDIPKKYVRKLSLGFLFPIRAFRVKPFYSATSILFHTGLIITPIFLFDHILLIERSVDLGWFALALSKPVADMLTLLTITTGILLLIMRYSNIASRFLSRKQDFIWLLLLMIPFITGYINGSYSLAPQTYKFFILMHILSGNLILLMLPFTKIAHCVLLPLSQWITARAWKFVPQAGEKVWISLEKEGEKV